MNNTTHYTKEQIRNGIFLFFLSQGLCFSTWASRIPDVKELFTGDDAFYWGMILFLIPVGKFIAIPLAGYLVSKLGSRTMVQVSILGYALSLLAIGLSPTIWLLGVALFCFGVFWNMCDISLNTQGIQVERIFRRTIMASFHGCWSLAACFGALIGFIMIVSGIEPRLHFAMVSFLILLMVLYGRRFLQEDNEEPANEKPLASEPSMQAEPVMLRFVKNPEILLLKLGLLGLFALIVESAMFDWSNVYFESVLQVPKSMQIGFLVFMIMMTVGRFLTNWAYGLFGKRKVLQIAGALIFIGFFVNGLMGRMFDSMVMTVIVNSIGFMFVGFGISCMVPTIYSFVGAKSKTPVGIALTILSSISFIGSLIAPLLIGYVTQTFGMQTAYVIIGILGLFILLMATFSNAFRSNEENAY